MKFKNKSLLKVAALSIVAAFSFGLAISCVSNHKKNINKVFAEDDISTTWSYNSTNKTLSCTYASNYPNGWIDKTNQVSVTGLGGGRYELAYNVLGYPTNAVEPDYTDYGTFTLVFISGSYNSTASDNGPYGSITAYPQDISGLNSNTEYEIYLKVEPTGDMNQQGSGGGSTESGTVIYYDADLGFYYGTTERVELTVTRVDFTGYDNFVNGTATVYLTDGDNQYSTTMSNVSLDPIPSDSSGGNYTGTIYGYIDESQCSVNYHPLESVPLDYEIEPTPEPPDITSLEWIFDDYNYYYTASYSDQEFYNFNLKATPTGISYAYYAVSKELYVECELEAIDSTNPYDFSTYTFIYSVNEENVSVNDGKWTFTNAYNTNTKVTETVVFSENDVIILGWVYHDGLMYNYNARENADITLTHIVYHNEPSTATANNNYVYLYYDVSYLGDFVRSDVITIQDDQGDEINISPSAGTTTDINSITVKEFTGSISGPSTSVYPENSIINVSCNSTPYSYRGNYWSYDDYSGELFYCDREQYPGEVAILSNVQVGDTTTTLTYSSEHLEKEIVVSGTPSGTTLEGMVTLEENDLADFQVRLTIPNDYDFGWNYDSTNHSLVYYDEDFGGVYSMTEAVNNVLDQVITLTYSGRSSTSGTEDIQTIELDYSSVGGYDDSANTVSGDALLDGSNQYITVLLENVSLLEANTWVYIDGRMYWKDINSSNIDTNYLDIKKFVYVTCEDNIDNEYAEIDYTYTNDGTTTNLPTLTLNGGSYSPDGEIYYVRGTYYGREVEIEIPESKWKTREYGTYDYEVIFDGNGATSGSMATDEFNITEYSYTYELPQCAYQREGYSFTGWAYQPDETVMTLQPGTTQNINNGTTTFYAIWEEITYCTITFNANGGSGTMESLTFQKGTETEVPDCKFVREGYTFVCWAVGSPTSSTKVYVGDPVTVNGDYALYAVWESSQPITPITYTISFNANGGIGYMEPLTVEAGRNQVPQCGFTRPGYVFQCWAVGSADSSDKISAGSYVTVDSNYALFAVWGPAVKPDEAILPATITQIEGRLSELGVEATFDELVGGNEEYISKEAGEMVKDALLGTTLAKEGDYDSHEDYEAVVAAQKELVETVVATGLSVEATKASSVSGAKEIDKALPDNANFSVEGEIKEFYDRQMAELFGGQTDRKRIYRSDEEPTHSIDTDVSGMSKDEAVDHLENEQSLYENMVDYVDTGVEHMGKAALKLRVCSGESVTVQVKSYVTEVKVSSYREFDKAAADKEFVEAVYKAILLSMQHEVISILESEHKPSNNAEKEAQYQKELDAVKDLETFEIMVTEVLRQKYVELTGTEVADVDAFKPIYWEIFTAWALDQPSPYAISLEELTQTTIEQSKNRAGTFVIHSDLSKAEWGFIAGIAGGAALIIAAAAIIPTIVYKKRKEEGIN